MTIPCAQPDWHTIRRDVLSNVGAYHVYIILLVIVHMYYCSCICTIGTSYVLFVTCLHIVDPNWLDPVRFIPLMVLSWLWRQSLLVTLMY
jgi:hypothetical protein